MPTGIGMLGQLLNQCFVQEIDNSELNVQPLHPILTKVPLTIQTVNGTVLPSQHILNGVDLLVGQGATLAGVAKFFVSLWNPKPDWAKALKPEQYEAIGLELFKFGTTVAFGTQIDPEQSTLAARWATGVLLPVPALLETSLSTQQLVVDFSRFETVVQGATHQPLARVLVGSLHDLNPFSNPIPYTVEVSGQLKDSPLPSPADVVQRRAGILNEFGNPANNMFNVWQWRLRWNPYAAAVPIIYLLDATNDSQRAQLIQTLFSATALSDQELDHIARTSAGVVLLRAAFFKSEGLSAAATARARIAGVLRIDVTTDLRTCDPRRKEPVQPPPLEPPSPASANLKAKRVKGLKFARSFLGRSVSMVWDVYHSWEGPSSLGAMYPRQYFYDSTFADRQALKAVGNSAGTALNDDQLADRLAVINSIFEIEAYADGGRSADSALLSVGLQQFSFHVETEGTLLFWRLRGVSDLWFDVFLRSAGLDVGETPKLPDGSKYINVDGLASENVTIAIPQIGRPTASSASAADFQKKAWLIKLSADGTKNQWCVPGTVGKKAGTRAFPTVTNEAGQLHTDCHDAFDWKGTKADEFAEQLVARWAVGARLAPEFIRAQMELCVNRFNQVVRAKDDQITVKVGSTTETHSRWELLFQGVTTEGLTFQALFSSPAIVTVLVDCFINTPAAALPAARRAYDRAAAGWCAEKNTSSVNLNDSLFRVRMLLAYLSERRFFTASVKTPAPDRWFRRRSAIDTAPPRVAKILDRLEETTPDWGFEARRLRWTDTFHW